MFGLNVTYTLKPGKLDQFLEELNASGVPEAVRQEAGCLKYDYYQGLDCPDQVLLVERWTDRKAQEVHLTQPHMEALKGIKAGCVADTLVEKYDFE